jgi:hypothetical protein
MLCQSIGDAGSLLPARRSSQAVAFGPIQSTWGEPRRLLLFVTIHIRSYTDTTITVVKTHYQLLHLSIEGDNSIRSLDHGLKSTGVNAHNCRHATQITKYEPTTPLACIHVTQLV